MRTLRIETGRPQLDIQTTRAQMQIRSRMRRFTVKRTPPEMSVDRKRPTMRVNWKKTWASMGRRSPGYMRQYMMSRSRRAVQNAIREVVNTGEELASVQDYMGSTSSPFGTMAWRDMMNSVPEVNVASVPAEPPDVTWDPGYMHIEWTAGDIEIEWDESYMPDFDVTPYSIEIRLQGRPEVHISVDEGKVTSTIGKKVNRKI